MAEVALTDASFVEVTSLASSDLLFVEAAAGPRKIQHGNSLPRKTIPTVVTTTGLDITNDTVWIWDDTDDLPKQVSIRDLVFGNHGNVVETDDFTLVPGTHNVRAVELSENLPDVVSTVTLDGGQANIGGCDFLLTNFRNATITVTATNGITMYVAGTATDGTIGARQAATITVNDAGDEAIFSGG